MGSSSGKSLLMFDRYTSGVCSLCSGLHVKKAWGFENKKIMYYALEKRMF